MAGKNSYPGVAPSGGTGSAIALINDLVASPLSVYSSTKVENLLQQFPIMVNGKLQPQNMPALPPFEIVWVDDITARDALELTVATHVLVRDDGEGNLAEFIWDPDGEGQFIERPAGSVISLIASAVGITPIGALGEAANVQAALEELVTLIAAKPSINDAGTSATVVFSAEKVLSLVASLQAAINGVATGNDQGYYEFTINESTVLMPNAFYLGKNLDITMTGTGAIVLPDMPVGTPPRVINIYCGQDSEEALLDLRIVTKAGDNFYHIKWPDGENPLVDLAQYSRHTVTILWDRHGEVRAVATLNVARPTEDPVEPYTEPE